MVWFSHRHLEGGGPWGWFRNSTKTQLSPSVPSPSARSFSSTSLSPHSYKMAALLQSNISSFKTNKKTTRVKRIYMHGWLPFLFRRGSSPTSLCVSVARAAPMYSSRSHCWSRMSYQTGWDQSWFIKHGWGQTCSAWSQVTGMTKQKTRVLLVGTWGR